MEILQSGHKVLGETVLKTLRKGAGIEGQFTNHSLDLQRQQPEYRRKEVPYKMIEISKKFDSCEAGSS